MSTSVGVGGGEVYRLDERHSVCTVSVRREEESSQSQSDPAGRTGDWRLQLMMMSGSLPSCQEMRGWTVDQVQLFLQQVRYKE